jgi:hypothetical protein
MTGPIVLFWVVLLGFLFLIALSGIRFIPNNRIGIVEKRWSLTKGSVKSSLIALNASVTS